MDMSAVGTMTVVVAVAVLLAGVGSEVVAETVAVLVSVPSVCGATCTTMSTVALAPPGKMPRLHVTVVEPEHVPALEVADFSVTPAGSESVTLTPLVVDCPEDVPLFVTVR